ncbi:LppM family (lipo)protein [Cellulomonas sp. P22]|uniref:LppM family (lipo)protein n=1 Tax=Cellulomonas sp. P22 TaxID=3373189 RepID=UPI003791117C
MPRRTAAVALVALVTLGLAGCVRVDLAATLHPDDTLSGTLTFAVSEAFAERSGLSAEDLVDSLELPALAADAPGTTSEPFVEDGFVGRQVTIENGALDTFGGDGASVQITRVGDEFVVAGSIDVSQESAGAAAGEGADDVDLDDLDVRVAVTFPGGVREHNGDLSGRTVTWHAVYGDRLTLEARGSATPGAPTMRSTPGWVWLGAGVAGLATLLATLAERRRRAVAEASRTTPPTASPDADLQDVTQDVTAPD